MDAATILPEYDKDNQTHFTQSFLQKAMTLAEYEALPKDIRIEVIDGVVYDMASPSQIHQELLSEILFSIKNYLRTGDKKCKVFPAPFDVKLHDEPLTIVQPDILVVCDKNKLDGKRTNGAPDWVIEIVSPSSTNHDYLRKLSLYSSAGVREYWIVNPMEQNITVYDLDNEHLIFRTYTFRDEVPVSLYGDFAIDFGTISEMIGI